MKFAVYAPKGWFQSAGVRVLLKTNELLNQIGHKSRLIYWGSDDRCTNDEIVVYPESVGDALKAKRAIRYALNKPGAIVLGVLDYKKDTEIMIYWDDWIKDEAQKWAGHPLTDDHRIKIVVSDPSLFFNDGNEKTTVLAYQGKGQIKFPIPEPHRMLGVGEIPTHEEFAAIMRQAKRVYCCDGASVLREEVVMCGAELWMQGESGWVQSTMDIKENYVSDGNIECAKRIIKLCNKRGWY